MECGRLFTGLDYGEELTEADVVIPALEHDWSEWKVTKTPTCVSEGESERVCKRDASHTETVKEAADPYAHKWGKASYTWSDDYSEVTAERICQNDKTHKQTENVQTISEVTKAATCTKKGKITYTATFKETHDDGFVFETQEKKADIPATGHDWGEWVVTKEPTEKQKGEEIRTCKNDPSHTEKRDIPEKDHQHRPKKMEEKDSVNAKDGNIDCWVCDCGRYFTDPEGENEIEEDVVFFHYFCTDGDGNHWTRGGNAFFTFIFKRSVEDGETFSRFLGILIDGISVDKKYYTAEKGSVIVRIDPEYMETLAGGEHKLTAVFTDGTDDAVFKIVGADTPATGDNNHTVIWIIVMAASFLGLLILFITAERKYRKRQ